MIVVEDHDSRVLEEERYHKEWLDSLHEEPAAEAAMVVTVVRFDTSVKESHLPTKRQRY